MQPISSPQNPQIKLLKSLEDKKGRREAGLFLAEGHAMLERALDEGWQPRHLVSTKRVDLWEDVQPLLVTEKVMSTLSSHNNPQDVLASFPMKFQPHPGKTGVWLALEEIRDPGNLGTIIRTADAAGAAGIILVGDCCDPYSPECIRATTGSVFAMPLVKMNEDGFLNYLKAFPGPTIGTVMGAKHDYRSPITEPALIVLGTESKGLSAAVTSACSKLVRIPMKAGVESLNVATAAALLLYQAVKS
jgi:RNA methyltransferase, TrmH family